MPCIKLGQNEYKTGKFRENFPGLRSHLENCPRLERQKVPEIKQDNEKQDEKHYCNYHVLEYFQPYDNDGYQDYYRQDALENCHSIHLSPFLISPQKRLRKR